MAQSVVLPPLDAHGLMMGYNSDAGGGARRSSNMDVLAEASEMASTADKQAQNSSKKTTEKEKQEPPPAWAEMKTKAGKDRKRLPLACIACRRKKIRCSGEKPACKHCLRSRIPCVYKVTTRKAAPRTDYMAMLDKRLKRMEDRVIKLIPKENQSAVPRAVVRPALPTLPNKTTGKKRAADEAFGADPADLDKWSKTRHGSKVDELKSNLKGPEADEKSLLLEGAEHLPSQELQEHLAEVYFDYVYGQSYPLLHKPSFMSRLAAGNVAPVLVLAVCAISARFSNHPELRTEPAFLRGEEWAKAARDIALKRWDTPNLTVLIVFLLLGLHEFGTCHGGRSWMLAGMAQRMAFALLLHQDLDHDGWGRHAHKNTSEISPTDREIRRRAMWACFLMDRFNASGTDRPMQMSEDFVKIPLPVKESLFEMELSAPTETLEGDVLNPVEKDAGQLEDARQNMGTSAYYIKLVAIWGRLVHYWNMGGREKDKHPIWSDLSELTRLRKAVDDFKDNLPSRMTWNQENLQNHEMEHNANQFVFLHLVYHQLRLFMNRWALPSSGFGKADRDIPKQFHIECARAAIDAANNVSLLIKEAFDHNVTAPFAGYCAFYSSTVHVQGVFSKSTKLQEVAKQNLAYNVKYLTKMKKYWGMFHFVTENLKELYRQHADAVLKGSSDRSDGKSDGILQYGDWFDRYPSGVSETDYEDPASANKAENGPDTVLGQKSDLQSVEEFFASLSPATKAAQLRKQARRAKAKKAADEHARKNSDMTQATDAQQDLMMNSVNPNLNLLGPAGYGINGTGLEGAQNYNLLDNHNPLIQPPMLSQLDRHMVLSSYAGMDPASAASISNTINDQQTQQMGDASAFAPDSVTNGLDMWNLGGMDWGGLGADASTAWFMPFNLDPPTHLSPDDVFAGAVFPGKFDFDGMDLGLDPTGLGQ